MPAFNWVSKGNKFLKNGRFNEAIHAYKRSIEIEPKEFWDDFYAG